MFQTEDQDDKLSRHGEDGYVVALVARRAAEWAERTWADSGIVDGQRCDRCGCSNEGSILMVEMAGEVRRVAAEVRRAQFDTAQRNLSDLKSPPPPAVTGVSLRALA